VDVIKPILINHNINKKTVTLFLDEIILKKNSSFI